VKDPVTITKVEDGWIGGAAKGFLWHSAQRPGADSLAMFIESTVRDAKRFCASQEPVFLSVQPSGRGKASVLRIVPAIKPESFLVVGHAFRFLELNPYHQRWYLCSTSRYATPLTRETADALCARIQLESVHDADADPAARVLKDDAERTPQLVPDLPPYTAQPAGSRVA